MAPQFTVREWNRGDDADLRTLMRVQMDVDAGWPPDYARTSDLTEWLATPANLGRWVAVDPGGRTVGHVGIGEVHPGPIAELLRSALQCELDAMAEICRIVVDPNVRGRGLSRLLTRRALRACIERRLVPVSNVLSNRGSWLTMMLSTGWRNVGSTRSLVSEGDLVALIPPQKFIDAVFAQEDPLDESHRRE
jgi:GNAT superfamily N-acetyltransferase